MKVTRLLSLPLVLGICLSMSPCHAWWPLPSKRDVIVATIAIAGTFFMLRSYYFDQENRIKATITAETERLRQQNETLQRQVTDVQATILAQHTATRAVIQDGAESVVEAIENRELQTRTQLAEILHFVRVSHAFLLEHPSQQGALTNPQPKFITFQAPFGGQMPAVLTAASHSAKTKSK